MANIYQIKMTLEGSKPPIWRRILIEDNIRLDALHRVLNATMGWCDCHLWSFETGWESYGPKDPNWDDDFIDAKKHKLNQLLSEEGQKIQYVYDFGDDWRHLLTLEKILPKEKGQKYPQCIKGKGNCPPEDCGGIWGFAELLKVIKDKKHPEHDDMMEWLDEEYDPQYFDLEEINQRLR